MFKKNLDSELTFKSSRSGGKGGQNVNKVETKIELLFDVMNSRLLNGEEKKIILKKLEGRISKNGILRIVSQSERSRLLNKIISIEKFYALIETALKKEKVRKKTKLTEIEKQKRLNEKRNKSLKKELRKVKVDKEIY